MRDKCILITGGTGTLGKALLRRLYDDNHIVIYSRDEYKQVELHKEYPNADFYIGDIRDKDRLRIATTGIDIIIHAAALKHTTNNEENPYEAVKTNVMGTQNVIDCTAEHEIAQVLLISTDKAVQPVNLYGATKMCAERMIKQANIESMHLTFKYVRYGNVWGSRGSVLEKWLESVRKDEPFNVRNPDSTRFHITQDQAVDLVLHSLEGDLMENVPTNLPAYRLGDLADEFSKLVLKPYNIIDQLPGEKLHESLDYTISSEHAQKLSNKTLNSMIHEWLKENY